MQYLGGKSRIAKPISEIINRFSKDKIFVSPFCGSCAVESRVVAKKKYIGDSHKYLIAMFKAIQDGWEIPDIVSKEQYDHVKINKDENPALTGFAGFACSFGGKWFGGYARSKSEPDKNYARYSKNSLLRKMVGLQDTVFFNTEYDKIQDYVLKNSVVYCDPPYENTTKYSNSKEFDHEYFWNWVRTYSANSLIFVSEYNAPKDFVEIWNKSQVVKMDARNKDKIFSNIDRLFVHESNYDKIRIL